MEMIVGGAWQGKTAYVRTHYPEKCFLQSGQLSEEELFSAQGLLDLHMYIRKALEEGRDVSCLAENLCEKNPELVLTVQELGSGVVPMDPFERRYRELTGRICTYLAAKSTRVIRIVAGIPMILKDSGMNCDRAEERQDGKQKFSRL